MSTADSGSQQELLTLLKDGDSAALGSLHTLYHRKLYSMALRITGSREDAEEVVQDTFFRLWRKCSQFDSTRGSLIGWLLTITRRRAIERIRERKEPTYSGDEIDDISDSPAAQADTLDHEIARQLVSVAAAHLPEAQRSAITLAYFEGLTLEEIASRTQTPVGTLKHRVRCGLRSMKKALVRPRGAKKQEQFPVLLKDIVITEELERRPTRQRDPRQEADSLHTLGESADSVDRLVDLLITMPLAICRADSAGLSLLQTDSKGEQRFLWTNLSGTLASYVGESTPRNFSPCGVTMDCGAPQLFRYPGRYFHYFAQVEVPIVEGLVIPFNVGGKTEGTIWIASHHEGVGFDSEDVRVMSSLAEFVGSTVHLSESLPRLFGASVRGAPGFRTSQCEVSP